MTQCAENLSQRSPSTGLMAPEQIQARHPILLASLTQTPLRDIVGLIRPKLAQDLGGLSTTKQSWRDGNSPHHLASTHRKMLWHKFLVDNINSLLQQHKLSVTLYFDSLFHLTLYSLWSRNCSQSRKKMP